MKISLKNLRLQDVERLSREQLKDILGGQAGSGGDGGDEPGGGISFCANNCSDGEGGSRTVTHTCPAKQTCVAVAGDAIYCDGERAKLC